MDWISAATGALVAAALAAAWQVHRTRSAKSERSRLALQLDRQADAHRVLEESLHRALAAVEKARVGIIVTTLDGEVVQANAAAQHFVGARHGAALAESKLKSLVEEARSSGRPAFEELEIRSPAPRILAVRAEPIGETSIVAYIDDVTERRKVDAARTDFVANVSHELKTPVGALSLLAETLQSAEDPIVQQRLIARIGEQSARMNRLVDDILDLSLVEAAHDNWALVDLHKVVASAAARLRDIASAADVTMQIAVDSGELFVMGDERQLVSAVSNLMTNAITYTAMAADPKEVSVSVLVGGQEASIVVADTGIGIPLKHQQRIFERFYRVDSGRSRETGGTGLGLAIVRHVAINHGGRVEVESSSGVGSEFRIVLPMVDGRAS